MPEKPFTVAEFLRETWDDYNSPTTSNFTSKIGLCKNFIAQYEETIDFDRSNLTKLKKSLKALSSSGNLHVSNETYLAENLLKLSQGIQREDDFGIMKAFLKFSVVTKELSTLMRHLMQKLNNTLMFSLDNFLKHDLAGMKGDLKKPFDKASKEYDIKFNKIEKEKKQIAKDAGMIKTEVTGPEVAEEMERERRIFQLQTCEYLLKANDIKTKKEVDLLNHLVDFYHAQNNYFQDGLKTLEHYQCYVEELSVELSKLRTRQDQEKKELGEIRDVLKKSVMALNKESNLQTASQQSGYRLHQLQGNKIFGYERSGWLLKKSEGKMRKVWQKRKCSVRDGNLYISHSDATKDPVKLNLLTCQVKLIPDDPSRKCFDLISSSENRTYHFQADDPQDLEAWTSVLNNAKNSILMKAFQSEPVSPSNRHATKSSSTSSVATNDCYDQRLQELSKAVLQKVRQLKGNDKCCDCGMSDPEWLSVNLGVLICLECCGVHRDMGVHISRTQSVVIDDIVTSQLLLARVMTNQGFNDIMEATLDPRNKPIPRSTMDERKLFIRQKYEKRKYAIVTSVEVEDRRQDLKQAIHAGDIYALLQVYAEGIDFMEPLPEMANNENALHLAIMLEDGYHLYIVDFIIQNTSSKELGRRTSEGNNALHLCAMDDKSECMKLILRSNPGLCDWSNNAGQTPMQIAMQKGNDLCVELISHAISGKSDLFEHVNIDWEFIQDDHDHGTNDYSDDDLDWDTINSSSSFSTLTNRTRSRPGSLVMTTDALNVLTLAQRSMTIDNLLPPQPMPRVKGSSQQSTTTTTSNNQLGSSQSSLVNNNHDPTNQPLSTSIQSTNHLIRKKAPAPPPPAGITKSHIRNPSDPGFNRVKNSILMDSRNQRRDSSSSSSTATTTINNNNHTSTTTNTTATNNNTPPALPPKPTNRMRSQILDLMIDSPQVLPPTFHTFLPTNQGKDGGSASTNKNAPFSYLSGLNKKLSTIASPTTTTTTASLTTPTTSTPPTTTTTTTTTKQDTRQRCVAMFNCDADNDDELSFKQGEVIVVVREDDEDWWEGEIEGDSSRKGLFPVSFVSLVTTHHGNDMDTF